MHIFFVKPWVLVLLWLAPVIGIAWLAAWRIKARALERFMASAMRAKLCPPPQTLRFYWQWSLILLGFALVIIAAARPQWGLREETVMQRGRDLVIAVDVSRSMLAQDVHPNRLQRSKADIQDLLRELRGDRAALIAFRGKAIQLCPLTTDYAYLEQALAEMSPESAPRGETDIGDAIAKAMDAFENDTGAFQAVILISDGEDLVGKAKAAAENAKKKGVVIFTVGLGDPQGAKIPSSTRPREFMTYQGQEVISKLQHETLKNIAEITSGAYVPVGTSNVKLGSLYRDHLSKLTARDIEESILRRHIDRYQWFLLPSVLAFLAGALLSMGRFGRTNKPAGASAAQLSKRVAAFCLTPLVFLPALACGNAQAQTPPLPAPQSTALVQTATAANTNMQVADTPATNLPPAESPVIGRDGARRAQLLYRAGAYHKAAKLYLEAMAGQTTALQNDCLYNAACSLYRAGQYQAAAEKFSELAARPSADAPAAYFNSGCALFQLAEQAKSAGTNQPPSAYPSLLERSGQAFQQTLRLKADDAATRANLGAITNFLPSAREQAKIKALLDRYQGTPPPQLADTMLTNQRKLIGDLPAALTNATPGRIGQMEALSAQQRDNMDMLIPLKATLASALSQMAASSTSAPQQAAQIEQHLEAMRNVMQQATEGLRDLEPEAARSVMMAEAGIYNLWKGMAQFPQLLHEDIYRQTNAIALTTSVLARTSEVDLPAISRQQKEARELTGLFVESFSQAVPTGGTPVKAAGAPAMAGAIASMPSNQSARATATNAPEEKPEITAETRSNILALAQQAQFAQDQALGLIEGTNLTASLPKERKAYELLKEIEKLLPKNKDKNQQQNQQQDQKQDQQQDQQQQQQQPQDQQKNQPQQPQPQQNQPKEQQQQQPQDQPDKDKDMTPAQARALLEKAQQRDKDHREKRERDPYIQPSPIDRDW